MHIVAVHPESVHAHVNSSLLSNNFPRCSLLFAPSLSVGLNFLSMSIGHHLLSQSTIVCYTQFYCLITFHAAPLVIMLLVVGLMWLQSFLFTVLALYVIPMLLSSSVLIMALPLLLCTITIITVIVIIVYVVFLVAIVSAAVIGMVIKFNTSVITIAAV